MLWHIAGVVLGVNLIRRLYKMNNEDARNTKAGTGHRYLLIVYA